MPLSKIFEKQPLFKPLPTASTFNPLHSQTSAASEEALQRSLKPSNVIPDFYLVPGAILAFSLLTSLVWNLPRRFHAPDGSITIQAPVPLSQGLFYELVPGAEVVHELVCAAFAFAFLFDLLTGVINHWNDASRRRMASMTCLINFSSCAGYFLLRSQLTPLHLDFTNRPLNLYRMVHWSFTSSTMIYMMGYLGQVHSFSIVRAVVFQATNILCGMIASYSVWPVNIIFFLLAVTAFTHTATHIWSFLGAGINLAMHPDHELHIARLRLGSVITWSAFGVIWVFSKLQLISPLLEESLIGFFDLVSKLFISLTLFHANFLSTERLELVRLLKQENLVTDAETTLRTKRSIENLQRIIDAAFSGSPLLDKESLLLLRLLRQDDGAAEFSVASASADESTASLLTKSLRDGPAGLASMLAAKEHESDPQSRRTKQVAALTAFQRTFLQRMRSEFKDPLNSVIAFSSSVLLSPAVDSEHRDILLQAVAAAQSLLLMIDNMLEYADLQAYQLRLPGSLTHAMLDFNLLSMVDSLNDFCIQRASDKWSHVDLLISYHPRCPTALQGDVNRLFLICRNLLDNSIKYTSSGMIRVHFDFEEIDAIQPPLELMQADSGSGAIDSSQLSSVQMRELLEQRVEQKAGLDILDNQRKEVQQSKLYGSAQTNSVKRRRVMLRILFQDSGSSIDPKAINKMKAFHANFNSNNCNSSELGNSFDDGYLRFNRDSGIGLGLVVVRGMLDTMGGSFAIAPPNPLAPGTCISIEVPMFINPTPPKYAVKQNMPLRLPQESTHTNGAALSITTPGTAPAGTSSSGSNSPHVSFARSMHPRSDSHVAGAPASSPISLSSLLRGISQPAAERSSSSPAAIHFTPLRIGLRLPNGPLRSCLSDTLTSAGALVKLIHSDPEMLQMIISHSVHVLIYSSSGANLDRMLLMALRSFPSHGSPLTQMSEKQHSYQYGSYNASPRHVGLASPLSSSKTSSSATHHPSTSHGLNSAQTNSQQGSAPVDEENSFRVTPHTLLIRVDPLFSVPSWLCDRPLVTGPPVDNRRSGDDEVPSISSSSAASDSSKPDPDFGTPVLPRREIADPHRQHEGGAGDTSAASSSIPYSSTGIVNANRPASASSSSTSSEAQLQQQLPTPTQGDELSDIPPELLQRLVGINRPINLPSLMRTLQKVCYSPIFF